MLVGGPRDGDLYKFEDSTRPVQQVQEKPKLMSAYEAMSHTHIVSPMDMTVQIYFYELADFYCDDVRYRFYRWDGWSTRLAWRVLMLRLGFCDLYGAMRL